MILHTMKRDILMALVIGFAIGALSAIVAVRLPVLWQKNNIYQPKQELTKNLTPTISKIPESSLVISEPADNTVSSTNTINLSGKTLSEAALLLESAASSEIVEASADGSFKSTVKLNDGANPIYITRLTETGDGESVILNVFYTAEKL